MHKLMAEFLEVERVISVGTMSGAVMPTIEGEKLFALRAYGEDADAKEQASVALVLTPEELATVVSKIARTMIDQGETEVLLQAWHETLLGPRMN